MMPSFATDYAIVIESSHNAAITNSMTEIDDRSLAARSMQSTDNLPNRSPPAPTRSRLPARMASLLIALSL